MAVIPGGGSQGACPEDDSLLPGDIVVPPTGFLPCGSPE